MAIAAKSIKSLSNMGVPPKRRKRRPRTGWLVPQGELYGMRECGMSAKWARIAVGARIDATRFLEIGFPLFLLSMRRKVFSP